MTLKRRNFLLFMGGTAGVLALGSLPSGKGQGATPFSKAASAATPGSGLSFQPIKVPVPLEIDGMTANKQIEAYSTFEVVDDIVLPEGYTYDVIGAWGDPVGDSRFGYNNDYLSFIETAPNEGFLTISFEYISGKTWMQTYPMVVGKSLPFEEVKAAATEGEIDAFTLADGDSDGPARHLWQQLHLVNPHLGS